MPPAFALYDIYDREIVIDLPLLLDEVDGLGMPSVVHLVQAGAMQDGETYLMSRLRRRTVTMNFNIVADSEDQCWEASEQLLRLAAQLTHGFRLRVTLPNGSKRDCHLRYAASMTMPRSVRDAHATQNAVMQCISLDNPTLYNPDQKRAVLRAGSGVGNSHFPLSFPVGFEGSSLDDSYLVRYPGSWRTYPTIELTGPLTDPAIYNLSAGTKLEMVTGYALDAGEVITFDLTPGIKRVTHSVDGDIAHFLTKDSDLSAWCLAPDPDVINGDNNIQVSGTNVGLNTLVEFRYYERFIGI